MTEHGRTTPVTRWIPDDTEVRESSRRAIYRGKKFKSLDPYLRAQLILVREGAKSDAGLDEQYQDCCSHAIDDILKDLRLNFTKGRWKKRFC